MENKGDVPARNRYFYQMQVAKSFENISFPKFRPEMNEHLQNYKLKEELLQIQTRNA
jgi:hypothetical protein